VEGRLGTHTVFQGHTDVSARVSAALEGPVELRLPAVSDLGPVQAKPIRSGSSETRIGVIELEGLLVNQNRTGLYSAGENPIASFREKLDAAAADPAVRAVVIRINSPGGAVTACDILAEDLRRFRAESWKPAVCCLMDVGTAGAYYVALGGDRIVAHPTTITGGIGALINHDNLQDAMGQLNVRSQTIRSAPLSDMGSVLEPLPERAEQLLREMVDGFAHRFEQRVAAHRPAMTDSDRAVIADGRVVPAERALALHLVDRLGYLDDAIAEAERLAGIHHAEIVLFQRVGIPAHSIYDVTPNVPIQNQLIPLSYPGLERTKLPTFLYLWEPDPTILR
jgi:protease-4